MTTEEKAKAYDKAIERARLYYCDEVKQVVRDTVSYIFPELKESEDERIIEAQLDYWRSVGGKEWHGVPVQDAIACLEKQMAQIREISGNEGKISPKIDGFEAELNALLKKYEHLSKAELQEPLEFYLDVIKNDLDVVREENKPKWTEGDNGMLDATECWLDTLCEYLKDSSSECIPNVASCINWLKSLKQRMEE